MTTRTATHAHRFEQRRKQQEAEAQLHHIRDLVTLRAILERYGATAAELAQCDAEIGRHRQRLARAARSSVALRAAG